MPAEHDGEFRTGCRVLAWSGVGVEDDAQCALGIFCKGDRARDQVAEAADWEEVGRAKVKVYDHDGDRRGLDESGEAGVTGEAGKVAAADSTDNMGVLLD